MTNTKKTIHNEKTKKVLIRISDGPFYTEITADDENMKNPSPEVLAHLMELAEFSLRSYKTDMMKKFGVEGMD